RLKIFHDRKILPVWPRMCQDCWSQEVIFGGLVMDLPTHILSGLAVGFIFFGHPEVALLIALGALVPDLDREYWFIPQKRYTDEQRHRALFHNVVMLAIMYAVSPFLSMGVFIHMLEDSFTTVKDRGGEWFYPFTRLAKRGRYDVNGN